MKRILFLICVLLLLGDLANDGYIGKALRLCPQLPGNISFTSSPTARAMSYLQLGFRLKDYPLATSSGKANCI